MQNAVRREPLCWTVRRDRRLAGGGPSGSKPSGGVLAESAHEEPT